MARGSKGSQYSDYEMFIVKAKKPKEGEEPMLSFSQKDENGKYPIVDRQKSITGRLVKVEPVLQKDVVMNDQTTDVYQVKLKFVDDNVKEVYLVDLPFTLASRLLVNSVLSITNFTDDITLSIYKNSKGYPSFGLWQNDEGISWKYKYDELPKPDEIKNKKGEVVQRDYEDVNKFFLSKLEEFVEANKMALMQDPVKTTESKNETPVNDSPSEEPQEEPVADSTDDSDDLPF